MTPYGMIYQRNAPVVRPIRTIQSKRNYLQKFGIALVAFALGGVVGPLTPTMRLEAGYGRAQAIHAIQAIQQTRNPKKILPPSVPVVFDPLATPDGATIDPVNTEFSLVVPKIGINAPIVASVDPAKASEYGEVLKRGIAHAATSFLPNEDGTVYLFSHSTNYDWFVRDMNAVFYHLKNLSTGDRVVLFYKGVRYTYGITGKRIVSPLDTSFLAPIVGKRTLILQTCWPPGSTAERLLIFAELVEERGDSL